MDNYASPQAGLKLRSTESDGVHTPHVIVDNETVTIDSLTLEPSNLATSAKQDDILTALALIATKAKQDTLLAAIATAAKQDTLLAAVATAAKQDLQATAAKQDTLLAAVATATKQDALLAAVATAAKQDAAAALLTLLTRCAAPALGTPVEVSIADTHNESAALGATLVRVVSTSGCHLRFGAAPVAVTTDTYLPADTVALFTVQETDKVSVIRESTNGKLSVTPCA